MTHASATVVVWCGVVLERRGEECWKDSWLEFCKGTFVFRLHIHLQLHLHQIVWSFSFRIIMLSKVKVICPWRDSGAMATISQKERIRRNAHITQILLRFGCSAVFHSSISVQL